MKPELESILLELSITRVEDMCSSRHTCSGCDFEQGPCLTAAAAQEILELRAQLNNLKTTIKRLVSEDELPAELNAVLEEPT